jgi:hypothetical protein
MKSYYPWLLVVLLCLAALTSFTFVSAHGADSSAKSCIDWPEATGRLAEMRSRAEACVGLLRKYGNQVQVDKGKLVYTEAKGQVDGVIASLITAVDSGVQPEKLENLDERLRAGSSGLITFCTQVRDLIPDTPGTRGLLGEMVKESLGALIKAVSEAVSALYTDHLNERELIRRTIRSQLEAAQWPDFEKVPVAK